MSSNRTGHLGRVIATLMVALTFLGALAAGQDRPAPKLELYGGYSFFYPGADVHGTLPLGIAPISSRLESNPRGIGLSATYNFNRWFGLTLDGSDHWGSGESTLQNEIDDAAFSNLSFGPKITFRSRHFSPFLEALVGVHRLTPDAFHDVTKLGFIGGGGLDLNIKRHFAIRMLRADYVMSNYQYGPKAITPATSIRGVRLQTGIVVMFGGDDRLPAKASCSIQPGESFAGEPLSASASPSNFNPKKTVKYSWSGPGIANDRNASSVNIDTSNAQPGEYRVTANLSDGSKYGNASCTAAYTIKTPRPPTIACSPDRGSIAMGASTKITSVASSPDGRRLAYSYTTTSGSVTGSDSMAVFNSNGAQPGSITVNCSVSDDRNPPLTATASTSVNVEPPPPPVVQPDVAAIERRIALRSVYFATAKPNEEHPDAGLLPSQEKTLTALAADFKTYLQVKPEARLALEGHADPRGSVEYNQALSQRRVNRTKQYLISLGVPEAQIDTRGLGEQHNMTNAEIKDAVEGDPELTPADRQRVLDHMGEIILASNRRVDVILTNAGSISQNSVRQYPFSASDSLTLLDQKGGTRHSKAVPKKPATKKK